MRDIVIFWITGTVLSNALRFAIAFTISYYPWSYIVRQKEVQETIGIPNVTDNARSINTSYREGRGHDFKTQLRILVGTLKCLDDINFSLLFDI